MPDAVVAAHERGVRAALAAGWAVLSSGGAAADAVVAAVRVMEDDDTFDAGRGAFLTRDGRVQLDALLMNGSDLRAGGVACVERLRNPIEAARLILHDSPHAYFVGAGAEQFAAERGMALIDNSELIVERERARLRTFCRRQPQGRRTPPSVERLPSSPRPWTPKSNGVCQRRCSWTPDAALA